ncbi:MAG: VanZ family protein [Myxococcales bacterium]|nr:VanZ family protein [Myxococcales bacterium]
MNAAPIWQRWALPTQVALVALAIGIGRAVDWPAAAPIPDGLLHVVGFFLLTLAICHALKSWSPASPRLLRAIAAGSFGVSLGAMDEWLQSWEPGRTSDLRDLAFDCGGILIALALAAVPRRKRPLPRADHAETSHPSGFPDSA